MKLRDILTPVWEWSKQHPGIVIPLLAFFAGAVVGKLI